MQDRKQLKAEKKQKKLEKLQNKQQMPLKPTKERTQYKNNVHHPKTIPGELKDFNYMPESYDPSYIEDGWFSYWEKNNLFKPECNAYMQTGEKFVIPIPPPNVTGSLHIGHSMMVAIQDVLIRYNRMLGKETLYIPGTDHAGIATQAVVEKKLFKETKKLKEEIGRENFVEKVFEWKNLYGNRIYEQMKRLGSSLDFSRQIFTLDKKYESAVIEAFNIFYEKGLIYRDSKIVNWSSKMKTTLSDLEVNHEEIKGGEEIKVDGKNYKFGVLYYFKYPILDLTDIKKIFSKKEFNLDDLCINENLNIKNIFFDEQFTKFVEVSTTRPETIFGDTAICINPEDVRFDLNDKFACNPLTRRIIPIIKDNHCDKNFGTGVLKITPSHDINDFEIGKRHNLKEICILDENNAINVEEEFYCKKSGLNLNGYKRFEARLKVIEFLKENNLFIKEEIHNQTLPFCSRSQDIIEPRIKKQWWMKCEKMGKRASDCVLSRNLEIHPIECNKIWFNWLNNIRDWCLSRQLWWGHRIPAWRVENENNDKKMGWIVARNFDELIEKLRKQTGEEEEKLIFYDENNKVVEKVNSLSFIKLKMKNTYILRQDEDVLDTWFSSGLWPFAIFGWPENTEDLKKYYPNSILETGYDILFFWVARMVMMSLELNDILPFKKILLHGIVRDAHGKKMSKSLGNVIDPIFVIEGITLKDLNTKIENVDEKEKERAIQAQKKDFPRGIPTCGADALRFALCSYVNGVKDINLDVLRVEGYRRLCNKLWNAFKFVKMICLEENESILGQNLESERNLICEITEKNFRNKETKFKEDSIDNISNIGNNIHFDWILNRKNETIVKVKESLEVFDFMDATQNIHKFFLNDFCDIFIEVVKRKKDCDNKKLLFEVFIDILKLFHPFMPFITEEIFQRLKFHFQNHENFHIEDVLSISISKYPIENKIVNQFNIFFFENIINLAKGIRSMMNSANFKKVDLEIDSEFLINFKNKNLDEINSLERENYDNNTNKNLNILNEFLNILIKGINEIKIVEKIKCELIDEIGIFKFGINEFEKSSQDIFNSNESSLKN